jgi:hypothetical protein
MRLSATYSPNLAAAVASKPDTRSSTLRGAFSLVKATSKSQEVFDEGGNAVLLTKNLPLPNSFSAQLLPGNLMQFPDGTVTKARQSMYS